SISLTDYPQFNPKEVYEEAEKKVERIKEIVSSIRSLRSDLRIEPSRKVKLYYRAGESRQLVHEFLPHILSLARLESLEEVVEEPSNCVAGFSKDFEFYLPVEEGIKVEELISSYSKRLSEIEKSLQSLQQKLSNENFLKRAPEEEVQKARENLAELMQEREKVENLLALLKRVV
ncbi:MAG: valine--tRNA ligase, partial [Aquificaceae bacterium]